MTIGPAAIKSAIQDELASVRDERVRTFIEGLLIEPKPLMGSWDYGRTGDKYLCWIVLENGVDIAYCEEGFGPLSPWGLVFRPEGEIEFSIGMDSGWFPRFLNAVYDSALADLPVWRVFRTANGVRDPISPEGSWDETWSQVMALREIDPQARYDCATDVLNV